MRTERPGSVVRMCAQDTLDLCLCAAGEERIVAHAWFRAGWFADSKLVSGSVVRGCTRRDARRSAAHCVALRPTLLRVAKVSGGKVHSSQYWYAGRCGQNHG